MASSYVVDLGFVGGHRRVDDQFAFRSRLQQRQQGLVQGLFCAPFDVSSTRGAQNLRFQVILVVPNLMVASST